jgi:hypothetical protein
MPVNPCGCIRTADGPIASRANNIAQPPRPNKRISGFRADSYQTVYIGLLSRSLLPRKPSTGAGIAARKERYGQARAEGSPNAQRSGSGAGIRWRGRNQAFAISVGTTPLAITAATSTEYWVSSTIECSKP